MLRVIYLIIYFTIVSLETACQDYSAEVLSYVTDIVIINGKLKKEHSCKIRINDKSAIEYTKVSIPYSGKSAPRDIKARIIDRFGSEVKSLKKKDVLDRSNISHISLYEDSFVKEFQLIHNEYPYLFEYSYTEEVSEFLQISDWVPVISKSVPTLRSELNILVSEAESISYSSNNTKGLVIDTLASHIRYTWEANYVDLVNGEIFSPPLEYSLPRVTVVPQYFNYVTRGSFTSWEMFGEWQQGVLLGLNDLPDNEKIYIDRLIDSVDSDKDKIKILYHDLQKQTRYINVTIDAGGLVPYPASYVSQNKYGDCKALTNYFMAVLEYAGIKSHYVKVYADDEINRIDTAFPSQQFNHIILCVPQRTDSIWLDCTSNGPMNYLGTFTQNRYGLVVSEKSSLVKTPALQKNDVLEHREVQFSLREDQQVYGKFTEVYKGRGFERLSDLLTNYTEKERDRIIRDYFAEEGFDMSDYSLEQVHPDSSKISIAYNASSASMYKFYGNEILIKPLSFSVPKFEQVQKRTQAVQINYPVYKTDSIEYVLPANVIIASENKNQKITSPFGDYTCSLEQVGEKLLLRKSFFLRAGEYSQKLYPEFYKFIKEVREIDNAYIVGQRN